MWWTISAVSPRLPCVGYFLATGGLPASLLRFGEACFLGDAFLAGEGVAAFAGCDLAGLRAVWDLESQTQTQKLAHLLGGVFLALATGAGAALAALVALAFFAGLTAFLVLPIM